MPAFTFSRTITNAITEVVLERFPCDDNMFLICIAGEFPPGSANKRRDYSYFL